MVAAGYYHALADGGGDSERATADDGTKDGEAGGGGGGGVEARKAATTTTRRWYSLARAFRVGARTSRVSHTRSETCSRTRRRRHRQSNLELEALQQVLSQAPLFWLRRRPRSRCASRSAPVPGAAKKSSDATRVNILN